MTNKEKQAREILNKYNQNHIVEWMDKVDRKTKDLIVDQVFDIDFEELERLYDNVNKVKEKKNYNITPIEVTNKELIDAKQKEEYYNLGEKVLENNELAIITLAGGQGTRLGHNGPKGSFKIDIGEKGKYLFEMIIDQLIDANKKYGVTIPYYIMTSVENNDETIAFFEDNNYFNYPKEYIKFFKQAEEPLVDKFGKLLINEDKVIKLASNGNGEIYKSLAKNKILDDMNSKNVKWIVVSGIDNILINLIDPIFIGLTIKQKNKIASKSIIKNTPREGGGVFLKTNGKPVVIEYVEVPEDIATKKDSNGEYVYGDINILNHLFKIDALEKIAEKPLPYHTAVKKCTFLDKDGNPVQDTIYKFEKFIFDAFVYFKDISLLRVKREDEFAPIKNKDGEDSPKTAKKLYEDFMDSLKK